MGGVLVDEEHLVSLLHDDVGVEHLPAMCQGSSSEGALRARRLVGRP